MGNVYTPDHVAQLLVKTALPQNTEELNSLTACDPTCGDGAILVPLTRHILNHLPKAAAIETLHRIVGIDINPDALTRCRQRLDIEIDNTYPDAQVDWKLIQADILEPSQTQHLNNTFNVVVGNPPYVRVQNMEPGRRAAALRWSFATGATDLYLIAFELALNLARPGGCITFITPASWLTSAAGRNMRRNLATHHQVQAVLDYRDQKPFPNFNTYTAITSITKNGKPQPIPYYRPDGTTWIRHGTIPKPHPRGTPWIPDDPNTQERLAHLRQNGVPLGAIAHIRVGIQTLADDVFILTAAQAAHLEPEYLRTIIKASLYKDGHDPVDRRLIFPYESNGTLIPQNSLAKRAPQIYQHLHQNRTRLEARDKGRMRADNWHALGRRVGITNSFGPKIITPPISNRPNFQLSTDPDTTFYSGYAVKPKFPIPLEDLVAALNSPDMDFFIQQTSRVYNQGWRSYAATYIENFPVPREIVKHLRLTG